jgi:hypothetical protein
MNRSVQVEKRSEITCMINIFKFIPLTKRLILILTTSKVTMKNLLCKRVMTFSLDFMRMVDTQLKSTVSKEKIIYLHGPKMKLPLFLDLKK